MNRITTKQTLNGSNSHVDDQSASQLSLAPSTESYWKTSVFRTVEVSIVIPVLNEAQSLRLLFERLRTILDSLDRSSEILFVDDGSIDGSMDILSSLCDSDARVRVIRLRRHFGKAAALAAAFDHAYGDVVVTMNADLQNDPADIPRLLEKIDDGYDVVSGWRIDNREQILPKRLSSKISNWLISFLTNVHLHDYACPMKAYRRETIDYIKLYGDLHRFVPALANSAGVTVAEIPVSHSAKKSHQTSYRVWHTLHAALDLLTLKFLLSYATRPAHVFGLAGLASFATGMLICGYLTVLRLFFGQPLGDRPLLLLGILMIMIGIQLIIMGLLGEMVMRTYHESQGKPIYVVRSIVASKQPAGSE